MEKGEYLATSYGETMYRGAEKTVFFLLLLGEKGEPITDAEVPVWGYFLQEEAKKMQLSKDDGCLICQLGKEKRPHRENRKGLRSFL